MKPRIRIAFEDFWNGFDPRDNYFTLLLSSTYDLELSDSPDFMIHSWFGQRHLRYRCTRIYFAGECSRPDFTVSDYALTFDHIEDPRHYRLPLYVLYFDPATLIKREFDPAQVLASKSGFCNFVYSNPRSPRRNAFLKKLSKYKRVDSGGRWLNNLGGPIANKLEFIANYKFTIAFENEEYPGYTTEKIAEPMRVNSLPIYWGNPIVERDFNPRSFLNWYAFGSDEALIERVIELDRDDSMYLSYLREAWLPGNSVAPSLRPESVLNFFTTVFNTAITPIAVRRRRLAWYDSTRVTLQRESEKRIWRMTNRIYFAMNRLIG